MGMKYKIHVEFQDENIRLQRKSFVVSTFPRVFGLCWAHADWPGPPEHLTEAALLLGMFHIPQQQDSRLASGALCLVEMFKKDWLP